MLVTEMTTPDYVPAMKRAAAIITDHGGRTAHAAIISRELSIPCAVGTGTATGTLTDGQIVTVDGSTGRVYEGAVPGAGEDISEDDAAANLRTKTNVIRQPGGAGFGGRDSRAERGRGGAAAGGVHCGAHRRASTPDDRGGAGRGDTQKVVDGLMKFAAAFDPRPVIYRTTDFKTNEYRNLRGGDRYEPERKTR